MRWLIYRTNMATAYAAGRCRQLNDPEFARQMPYWRYRHADGVAHPRPQHVAWNGLTLPRDHPFWKTNYPPNGWGCHCKVFAERAPAEGAATEPPAGWDVRDPASGELPGVDEGFDYAPGANAATPLADLIAAKLIRLDAPIGAAMWQALAPAVEMEQRLAWTTMVDRSARTLRADGEAQLATTLRPDVVAALEDADVVLDNAAVWLRDHELVHALRDAKAGRGAALDASIWRRLPELLGRAQVYLDTRDRALLLVFDAEGELGKVVVRVDYNAKGQFGGVRRRITSNFIRTGGLVQRADIASDTRDVLLGEV